MNWTKEKPTQAGWYWAFCGVVEMVEVVFDWNRFIAFSGEIPNELGNYSHWIGPLDKPELPTDEV